MCHSKRITRRHQPAKDEEEGEDKPTNPLLELRSLIHTSVTATAGEMPFRREESDAIRRFLVAGFEKDGTSQAMYISGVPGTGKTSTVQSVVLALKEQYRFNYVAVNAMELFEPKRLFVEIWRSLKNVQTTRVSVQSARQQLDQRFSQAKPSRSRRPVVLLIDELDMLCTKKQEVLYEIFNWTTNEHAKLNILAISNTLDLPERVMSQRISSRLGTNRVVFQPYTYPQIEEILHFRLGQRQDLVHEQAIELAAKKVANVSGDLRKALDLLRRGVEIAVERGERQQLAFCHVMEASREQAATTRCVIGEALSLHGFVLLRAALTQVQSTGVDDFVFHDLYAKYRVLCTGLEAVNPLHDAGCRRVVSELCSNRLLVTSSTGSHDLSRKFHLGMSIYDAQALVKHVDDFKKASR